jgi:hypothetical protein
VGGNGLHGFGDAGGARRPGGTRVTTMHAAVHGTNARTVATGGTLTSQALARILLLGLAELGDFLAKLGHFGEEGFHGGWEFLLKNDRGGVFVKKRPGGAT